MKRGPKTKPAVLKLMAGNPGKRPIKPSIQVTGKAVQPDGLGERGKAKWSELETVLGPLDLLTPADAGMAFLYCQAWDDYYTASATISERGYYSINQIGNQCVSAAVKIRDAAIERIRKWSGEFGLSPASRAGLRPPAKSDVDDLAQYNVG